MELPVLVGVVLAVVVGGTLQRVAGMGQGLVAAPLCTLLLGPVAGVTVSNMAAVVTAVLVLGSLRRDVDWRRFARLAPLIAVGSVLGALAVRTFQPSWLEVLVGASVLLALGALAALSRRRSLNGRGLGVGTGLAAGFMNTTAGVAAPAMTAYALASRWEHRSFAATLQPIFLLANLLSLITKYAVGATPPTGTVPWWLWPALVAAVGCGVGAGSLLARVVATATARRLAIAVATLGAVGALTRGLLTL